MQQQLLIEIADWYGSINNDDELPPEKGSEENKQGGHGLAIQGGGGGLN